MDPIDHLDFHQRLSAECSDLENLINSGSYSPGLSRRILVEKSKGLCRQLVIPNTRDAIVLQALSDGLYADIRGKAPTQNSFFEPADHSFSKSTSLFSEPGYGSYRAWLDFQKEIFNFSRNREYVVVTDIANFYDGISYSHLRNIISDLIDVREPVLDMLIFVLSGLLWQPDYMPRIEVGLPQINLDAPRILAHCFLYELDEYLESEVPGDFVRFMDDIDVGVDTIQQAKRILKCIDLALQTRHVRLNSGKTQILRGSEALVHFRVRENYLLDRAADLINRKVASGLSVARERGSIANVIRNMNRRKKFDTGNGEKILKRLISVSSRIGAEIDNRTFLDILFRRPASRSAALAWMSKLPLTRARSAVVRKFARSGMIVDDATYVSIATQLVETPVIRKSLVQDNIKEIVDSFPTENYFAYYSKIWLVSKYGNPAELLELVKRGRDHWSSDPWVGRLIGGLHPVFARDPLGPQFRDLINQCSNSEAKGVFDFHDDLRRDAKNFNMSFNYLRAVNISKRLGTSHSRFLLLLSALSNPNADPSKKARLLNIHQAAWADAYYRVLTSRATGLRPPLTAISVFPVP